MEKETFRVLGRPEALIELVTQQDLTKEEIKNRDNAYGAVLYLRGSRNRIANQLQAADEQFKDVIPGIIINAIAKSSFVKRIEASPTALDEEGLAYRRHDILENMAYVRIYFEILDDSDQVYFRPETSSFFVNIGDFYNYLSKNHFVIQAPFGLSQGFNRGDFSALINACVISGGLDLTLKGESLTESNTKGR